MIIQNTGSHVPYDSITAHKSIILTLSALRISYLTFTTIMTNSAVARFLVPWASVHYGCPLQILEIK